MIDRAAAALDHPWRDRGGQQERRLDVDRERLVEGRLRQLVRWAAGEDAGVVDEDVDVGCALGECADGVGRLEVGAHEFGLAAHGFDRGDHVGAARLAAAADQNMRSFARECLRRRAADARGSTGNQCSLSAQFLHSFLLS